MKYKFVVLIAIASFVSGVMLGMLIMQSEIDSALKKVESINEDLFLQVEDFLVNSNRFGLEAELNLIKKSLDLDSKGAPRRYIGEQYMKALNVRIEDLNRYRSAIEDDDYKRSVDGLIEDARKLMKEIEYSYY